MKERLLRTTEDFAYLENINELPKISVKYKDIILKFSIFNFSRIKDTVIQNGPSFGYGDSRVYHSEIHECKSTEDIFKYLDEYGILSTHKKYFDKRIVNIEFRKLSHIIIIDEKNKKAYISKPLILSMRNYGKFKSYEKNMELENGYFVVDISRFRRSSEEMIADVQKTMYGSAGIILSSNSEVTVRLGYSGKQIDNETLKEDIRIINNNIKKIQEEFKDTFTFVKIAKNKDNVYSAEFDQSLKFFKSKRADNLMKKIYQDHLWKPYNKDIYQIVTFGESIQEMKYILKNLDNPIKIEMIKNIKGFGFNQINLSFPKINSFCEKFMTFYSKNLNNDIADEFLKYLASKYSSNPTFLFNIINKYSYLEIFKIFENLIICVGERNWDNQTKMDMAMEILLSNDMKINPLIEYINSFRMRQGIDFWKDALITYRDYLSMRKAVLAKNVDTREYRIYPNSLKLNHDLILLDFSLIKEELDKEKEMEVLNSPDYSKLEYKDKEYSLIKPSKIEDLTIEGRKLSHCVGSYKKSVIDGETKIYFMRHNDNLDSPYITIEIRNNYLSQIQGKNKNSKVIIKSHYKFFKNLFTHLKKNGVNVGSDYLEVIQTA